MGQAARSAAAQAKAPVRTARPQDVIREYLRSKRDEIRPLLPKHMTIERLEYTMLHALREVPDLYQCARSQSALESFVQAAFQAALVGLEPGRALDLAYITPVRNRQGQVVGAKYETTYKGDLQLLYRSNSVRNIYAEVVRTKDAFEIELGVRPTVRHRPALDGDAGEIMAAYSVAKLANGEMQVEFMRRSEIDQAQSKSRRRNKNSGPWAEWYGEMAKKSVLRRHMKRLPLSTEILRLISQDQGSEYSAPVEVSLGAAVGSEVTKADGAGPAQVKGSRKEIDSQPRASGEEKTGDAEGAKGPEVKDAPATAEAPSELTDAQVKLLGHKLQEKGIDGDGVTDFLREEVGKNDIEALTLEEYRSVLRAVAG